MTYFDPLKSRCLVSWKQKGLARAFKSQNIRKFLFFYLKSLVVPWEVTLLTVWTSQSLYSGRQKPDNSRLGKWQRIWYTQLKNLCRVKSINHWRCDPVVLREASILIHVHIIITQPALIYSLNYLGKKIFWISRNETQSQTCPCHLPRVPLCRIVHRLHVSPDNVLQTGVYFVIMTSCHDKISSVTVWSLSTVRYVSFNSELFMTLKQSASVAHSSIGSPSWTIQTTNF